MKKTLFLILRSATTLFSVGFFIYFIFIFMMGIVNIGSLAGIALCIWIFCVSVAPVHRKIREVFTARKLTKFLYRAVNTCFIAFAIYGALVTAVMTCCAYKAPSENATVIVLGAQVKPWGPSAVLSGRISGAEGYLESNPDAKAVLSGGQGEDEHISEAQCMYETMLEHGVDPSRLYIEDRSVNTTENIKNSLSIIKENNLNSNIAIATDSYHQLRARIIANQLGIEESVGAVNSDTSFIYIPVFAVREWFALPYQVLFR